MTASNVVDMHREVSIGVLESLPCFAMRTPRGQKDPGHISWDPKRNNRDKHRETLHDIKTTDCNLGVHLFENVIDIDIDCDNPVLIEALDHFLPYSAHVWGRPSRPRTHRLYQVTDSFGAKYDPSMYPFLTTVEQMDDLKLEIRGGRMESGRYSLLPGSEHPSGEAYEWDDVKAARSTPTTVELHRVMVAVRAALVTAIIAPYWTEGGRNQMCMALSGFLHRAAAHANDMDPTDVMAFNKDDALSILEGIVTVADDDPADLQMRQRTFEQTWAKADAGENVTGATRLAQLTGDDRIVPLLYTLLVDSPELRELDAFFERYAVRNNTSNIVDLDKAGSRSSPYLMTMQDFHNSHMHRCITSAATGKRTRMSSLLVASARAIRVDGFCFRPGLDKLVDDGDEKLVNQWRGFALEPADEATDADVAPFLDYIWRIVAQEQQEVYDWVIGWCADLFQRPGDKPGTALVLVGKPGSGKSILGEEILRPIIGTNHSMQTNDLNNIVNNFNADSSNMVLVQCDEASNSRRLSDAARMKSLITDKTRRVEPKGVNAYQQEDAARYYITSNKITEAVPIVDGQADRRYSVIRTSDRWCTSRNNPHHQEAIGYWTTFRRWLTNENRAKIFRWLLDYEFDRSTILSPVDTEARRRTQQQSERGLDDWLMQIVAYEHPYEQLPEKERDLKVCFILDKGKPVSSMESWPALISYTKVEQMYETYRRKSGSMAISPKLNSLQIRQEFVERGLLPPQHEERRVSVKIEDWENGKPVERRAQYKVCAFPSLEAIRAHLTDAYGYEHSLGYNGDGEDIEFRTVVDDSGGF